MAEKLASRKGETGKPKKADAKAMKPTKAAKTGKSTKGAKVAKSKVPKAFGAKKEKVAEAAVADIRELEFHVVLDPATHDRLETLIALEVIARAGVAPPQPGNGSKKKSELGDARKSALKASAELLRREIKYVRKFL